MAAVTPALRPRLLTVTVTVAAAAPRMVTVTVALAWQPPGHWQAAAGPGGTVIVPVAWDLPVETPTATDGRVPAPRRGGYRAMERIHLPSGSCQC